MHRSVIDVQNKSERNRNVWTGWDLYVVVFIVLEAYYMAWGHHQNSLRSMPCSGNPRIDATRTAGPGGKCQAFPAPSSFQGWKPIDERCIYHPINTYIIPYINTLSHICYDYCQPEKKGESADSNWVQRMGCHEKKTLKYFFTWWTGVQPTLVGGWALPLWKKYEFLNWDDEVPNWMDK